MPTAAGNNQLSIHLLPHRTRIFQLCRKKRDGLKPSEMHIKVVIPTPTVFFTRKLK